jgi:hypothetical protein
MASDNNNIATSEKRGLRRSLRNVWRQMCIILLDCAGIKSSRHEQVPRTCAAEKNALANHALANHAMTQEISRTARTSRFPHSCSEASDKIQVHPYLGNFAPALENGPAGPDIQAQVLAKAF